ncbi:MAG: hypothetical protein EWV91_19135 [Microcystis aeruginosa Ma_QC_Ca_00000000_S207]|uniref:Uncharacterized protein n=1 Tax=Microcystis aeruginosa Ma_QC_Ca_00000000_S207 TaxID=2486251 RepID=A0A552F8Z5_MICAE|nr:MAG: hypothetical protein EWV91_19135 [Microcystis aeruginosa Ma_QC_Ca_00000000_S207]
MGYRQKSRHLISYQLSVISYQLSVISYQFTVYCSLFTEKSPSLNCPILLGKNGKCCLYLIHFPPRFDFGVIPLNDG